jgi:magnesium transporter
MAIISRFKTEHIEWLNITDASPEDLAVLKNHYHLPSAWLDMCVDVNHLPYVDEQPHEQFYLLRENTTERLNLNNISAVSTKIGLFISEKRIISIHRSQWVSLDKITHFEQVTDFVQAAVAGILNTFKTEAQRLQEVLDDIETELFMKNSSGHLNIKRLYKLKRKCSLNQRLLHLSQEVLEALIQKQASEVGAKKLLNLYQANVVDFDYLFAQVNNAINLCLALNEHKNNEVMKFIAVYSAYFLPISFIAALYGMNFTHMPELSQPYGYFACLGLMVAIVLATFFYINRRKF